MANWAVPKVPKSPRRSRRCPFIRNCPASATQKVDAETFEPRMAVPRTVTVSYAAAIGVIVCPVPTNIVCVTAKGPPNSSDPPTWSVPAPWSTAPVDPPTMPAT